MKFVSFISVLLFILIISCDHSDSETVIAKNQLGPLNPSTRISDLNTTLPNDSIEEFDLKTRFNRVKEIEVFNEKDTVSIIIEPRYHNDSIVTINEIQILDPKYKTKKGLSIESNFKTIYKNYKIDNIQNSINSVILSINEIGAYIVIDKKHLPSKLRYDSEIKIEANQIPDEAPIKYFWLKFEEPQLED